MTLFIKDFRMNHRYSWAIAGRLHKKGIHSASGRESGNWGDLLFALLYVSKFCPMHIHAVQVRILMVVSRPIKMSEMWTHINLMYFQSYKHLKRKAKWWYEF